MNSKGEKEMTSVKELLGHQSSSELSITDERWDYGRDGRMRVGPEQFMRPVPGTILLEGFGQQITWIPKIEPGVRGGDHQVDRHYAMMNGGYIGCVVPFQDLSAIHEKGGGVTCADLEDLIARGKAQNIFVPHPVIPGENSQNTILVKSRGAGITPDMIRLNLRRKRGILDVEPVVTETLLSLNIGDVIALDPLMRHGMHRQVHIVPHDEQTIVGWSNALKIDGVMPELVQTGGISRMRSYGGVDQVKISLEKSKSETGNVIEVRAKGMNSDVVSPRFGVTHQGIFYPNAPVAITPRQISSPAEIERSNTEWDYMSPSVFAVQWVGVPRNAKDILWAEMTVDASGKPFMQLLSGTDLGNYQGGTLRHNPRTVPKMPGSNGLERSPEKVVYESSTAPEVDIPPLIALHALAREWGVSMPSHSATSTKRKNPFLV